MGSITCCIRIHISSSSSFINEDNKKAGDDEMRLRMYNIFYKLITAQAK